MSSEESIGEGGDPADEDREILRRFEAYEGTCTDATAGEFCDLHPELMHKHVLGFFYSPERRGRPGAKETFVEPDLAPLPVYRGDS